MKKITILLLILPFILVYITPLGEEGKNINILLVYMAGCYVLLAILWLLKVQNEGRFEFIKKSFSGKCSLMSQVFISNYKNNKFSIFINQQGPPPRILWHICLHAPETLKLKLSIYNINPGPVLLNKKVENDSFFAFSNRPKDANKFINTENIKLLLNELLEISITKKAMKLLGINDDIDRKKLSVPIRTYSFFNIEKKIISTTVVTTANETIDIDIVKKNLDRLIEIKNLCNNF